MLGEALLQCQNVGLVSKFLSDTPGVERFKLSHSDKMRCSGVMDGTEALRRYAVFTHPASPIPHPVKVPHPASPIPVLTHPPSPIPHPESCV